MKNMAVANVKKDEGDQVDPPLSSFGIDIKDGQDFQYLMTLLEGADMVSMFKVFANLVNIDYSKDYYNPDVKYNKRYFAKYYGIDEKTFNKWVDVFCTPAFRKAYKNKYRFYMKDWDTIITTFGQCNGTTMKPYTRSEIAKLVYGNESKMSCKDDLDQYLNKNQSELNIFPPNTVYGFLKHIDAPEIIHDYIDKENLISQKQKLRILIDEVSNAVNMNAQERYKFKKQVRRFFGLE